MSDRIHSQVSIICLLLLTTLGCGREPSDTNQTQQQAPLFLTEVSEAQAIPPPIIDSVVQHIPSPQNSLGPIIILKVGDKSGNNGFFAFNWSSKSMKRIGFMTKVEVNRSSRVQANHRGVIVFAAKSANPTEVLFVRSPDTTVLIKAPFVDAYLDGSGINDYQSFPAFAMSVDGTSLIASAHRDLTVIDTGDGTLFTQILVAHLAIGKNSFEETRVDTFATTGFGADHRFERILVGWDRGKTHTVLFQDAYPGQLFSTTSRLWTYDPFSRTYSLLEEELDIFLDASVDGHFWISTNNDETCCSDINATNNLIILHHIPSRTTRVIYDEWNHFGNKGKSIEHQPIKAEFSPNTRLIAATIRHLRISSDHAPESDSDQQTDNTTAASRDLLIFETDGDVKNTYSNRELIGWLDNTHMLITQFTEEFLGTQWKISRSQPIVLNINTGQEHHLLSTAAECLDIQWLRLQEN